MAESLLEEICTNYTWLPMLALDRFARQFKDYQSRFDPMLDKRFQCKAFDSKYKVANNYQIYRNLFRELLRSQNQSLFQEEFKKEQQRFADKKFPYLPSSLTQKQVRNHFQEWFGFPLSTLSDVTESDKKEFAEKWKEFTSGDGPFELRLQNGGIFYNNDVVVPALYVENFVLKPSSLFFPTLVEAKRARSDLVSLYQKSLAQELNDSKHLLQCKEVFPRREAVSKCDPRLIKEILGHGISGSVYTPQDPRCNSICGKRECAIKRQSDPPTADQLKIEEFLNEQPKEVSPALHSVWKCQQGERDPSPPYYLFYDRIHGKPLSKWKDEVSDKKRREAMIDRLVTNLKWLHRKRIQHNDLHDSNILIDDKDQPFIIDWGQATRGDPTFGEMLTLLRELPADMAVKIGKYTDTLSE